MKKIFDLLKGNIVPFTIGVITSLIGAFIYSAFQPERIIISYELSQPLDIGKGLSTIFPSFELRHNGNTINNGVVQYIHGLFMNTSKKDVETTNTNNQIELILPDSCQVMEVYVPKAKNYEVEAIKSNNKIIFLLPEILKPNEKFDFYAIFNNHDEKELKFDTNTRIQDVSLQDVSLQVIKIQTNKIASIIAILVMIIAITFLLFFYFFRKLRRKHDAT